MTNSIIKTKGIVLSTVPYNDRTQFVHFYTEELGKLTCRITIGRIHRGGGQRTLYAPLTILDLVLEGRNNQDILKIAEAQLLHSPYLLSMSDPAKTAQCLYMAELLDKTIGEVGEPNPKLWDFISQSIELLELTHDGSANFHLVFTTRLCHLIGFHVDNSAYCEGMQFDISEGVYTAQPIYHPYYLTAESASWLNRLLDTNFSNLTSLQLTREQRNTLLEMMLTFLRIHMPETGNLRSVDVLKELFV
ncbi:MAG: DNA repair protein RecO [Bacteroidales bacterium]|nr:DNA repair protein RecO [Bacteroidales bacterium]